MYHSDFPKNEFTSPSQGAGTTLDDTDAYSQLSSQFVKFERTTSYIGAAIVFSIVLATSSPSLLWAFDHPWILILVLAAWIALLAILIFFSHFWPPIRYRNICWRLSRTGLEIRRGVVWKHRIAIPAARVQHVDVSQGPVQRIFGLGKLTVFTAGTKNASVEIDGLDHHVATALRDELIEQKEALDVT